MSKANTIIRPMGNILSTERQLCVTVNKGENKVDEQRLQGKERVLTAKDSQSQRLSGTEAERFGVLKKVNLWVWKMWETEMKVQR